ncbi:MAG: lipoprotein, partial [Muribaculaceae bacterium]|nr:lipoprotein [Muribaculaceae bacterium]
MKKTIIFALTLLLLAGCRHHRAVSPRLVELDSLIAVAPDSAAALLQAIPSDSLTDPENRAY